MTQSEKRLATMRKPCQLCGNLFISSKPQKKYCSPSCRVEVSKALSRSYYARRVARGAKTCAKSKIKDK